MKIKRPPSKPARIEMIPLIDVVFLLLVFFIYVMLSMTIHRGIFIDLPGTTTAEKDTSDYIAISVTQNQDIFLNKNKVRLRELEAFLDDYVRRGEDKNFYISAAEKAFHGNVVTVLDLLRARGIIKVFIETELSETEIPDAD